MLVPGLSSDDSVHVVNGYGHTDQYGDDKEGKKEAIYDDRCNIGEEGLERIHKVASRKEIGRLLLGVFRKLKVNFFREIVPLPTYSYIPKGSDKE